jgi:hypothetical protein
MFWLSLDVFDRFQRQCHSALVIHKDTLGILAIVANISHVVGHRDKALLANFGVYLHLDRGRRRSECRGLLPSRKKITDSVQRERRQGKGNPGLP